MTDKIEELERLIRACAEDAKRPEPLLGYPDVERIQPPSVLMLASGLEAVADALAALRTQRNEVVEECARVAAQYRAAVNPIRCAQAGDDQSEWYWSGKAEGAREIATAIRNLKSQDESR